MNCKARFTTMVLFADFCKLIYVMERNIYSFFDVFFSRFVLYSESSGLIGEEQKRGKKEAEIDSEIFKRHNEWHMAP